MSSEGPEISLRPLFPVASLAQRQATDESRDGYLWPVEVLFVELDRPVIVIELGFWPTDAVSEPLTPESWRAFRDRVGLPVFAGQASFELDVDPDWEVEFGPHTYISNRRRSFEIRVPRPDWEWEHVVQSAGSCIVLFGTGLGVDDETGALGVGSSAAAMTAVYAGRSTLESSQRSRACMSCRSTVCGRTIR
jgi:hypothetical protein